MRALVREGVACAVMPRNAFAHLDGAGVVAREVVDPVLSRTQSLVWPADTPLTAPAAAVRAVLLEVVQTLAADGRLVATLLLHDAPATG